MIRTRALGMGLLLSAVAGCAVHERAPTASSGPAASAANVTSERLVNAAQEPDQWMTYGGTYSEQRFSSLTQIDASNVSRLGLAWFADYETNQNQQGSPLYIDGVIYVSTARDVVYAFDARTGKQLWQYNPVIHGERLRYNLGLVNRGIAAWHGKIIMGTLDARLVAIDAKTGKEVWSTDTVPESLGLGEMSNRYSITMAARVAKGKVFIGASGGEYGVRGWIAAFDADTGKEVWRFWTVPGEPAKGFESAALERAAKTWNGEWWKDGGGGTVWDSVVYDPVTDLLYVGTGNATPWNGHLRDPKMGDDLYTASIVALNPDTGKYVWHYQETPADTWDYDAVSPMMTADLAIGGEKNHVILQPSKNGFFYVLEAATGKLISADPFTEVNWATGVDMKTGRPIVVPAARYVKQPWDLAPGVQGGHSWHPNAFSPQTGLIYIPAWEAYFTMAGPPPGSRQAARGGFNLGISMGARMPPGTTLQPYDRRGVRGRLEAWDPVARRIVWETEPFGAGLPTSGVLATAGNLVFMGDGSGKVLSAYDARTGAKLWGFDTQTAVFAAPITYQLDGVQYVAASVGGTAQGGYFAPTHARMLVFALGGTAVLPRPEPYTPPKLDPPPSTASAEVIAHGGELYSQYCSVCHGANGMQARTSFPNLTVTPLLWTQVGFDAVVLHGARADKGMGSFAADLKPEDAVAVRDYLISQANLLKTRGPAAFGPFFPRQETGHADN